MLTAPIRVLNSIIQSVLGWVSTLWKLGGQYLWTESSEYGSAAAAKATSVGSSSDEDYPYEGGMPVRSRDTRPMQHLV